MLTCFIFRDGQIDMYSHVDVTTSDKIKLDGGPILPNLNGPLSDSLSPRAMNRYLRYLYTYSCLQKFHCCATGVLNRERNKII